MFRPIPLHTATTGPRQLLSAPALRASPFITTRFLTAQTTSSTKKPFTPPSLSPARAVSKPTRSSPKTESIRQPKQLTYLVERTTSGNLPVYYDVRSGGTRKTTRIRKIVGNAQDLKKDLIEDFKFKKDDINVNPVTGHVVVKGEHTESIVAWLEARGF